MPKAKVSGAAARSEGRAAGAAGAPPSFPSLEADEAEDRAEALRLSAAEAGPALSSALRESALAGAGAGAPPPGPNARVDLSTGALVLLRAVSVSEDLVLEDASVVRAGGWTHAAGGTAQLVARPRSRRAGLPAEDAAVKTCSLCGARMDARWSRNAWTWRCAACEVDLCTACYETARPCEHEYAALPPVAPGGGMPRAPPPPGRPGSRPGWP